jgi:membrane-bound lytic murein transglycosylase D
MPTGQTPSGQAPSRPAPSPTRPVPPASAVAQNQARATAPFPATETTADSPQADPVSEAISEAQRHFEQGARLYDNGSLKQAGTEFDEAIDTLLRASKVYPQNARLRKEMTDLAGRVHEMELSATRPGEGFADQVEAHAAVDELGNVPTSPPPIDPTRRNALEAEVRNTTHDLPIDLNPRVLAALDYFQNGRGRKTIEVGLERIGIYRPMIERILREEGVPQDLIYLAQAESAFMPRAISRAKARGLWQFISSRGKEYGLRQTLWVDERSDPEKSTRAAARHLNDLYQEFNDWYLAMAAYNAGPYRIEQALKKANATTFWELADKKALPRETINYVPTILALAIIGKTPEAYGFAVQPDAPVETERVKLLEATDLRVIAENLDVEVDTLKELNPHVLRWTTPPDDSEFELILPKDSTETFMAKVVPLSEKERILWRYHNVAKGETLSVIARKYAVSVSDITVSNKITTRTPLRIGQELQIPVSGVTRPPAVATRSNPSPARIAQAHTVKVTATALPSTYRVKRGDTLTSIAAKFNVTVAELKKWNKLASTRLDIGQKLSLAPANLRQAN